MALCRNCSNQVDSNFCSFCGQPGLDVPYSFKTIKNWTIDQVDINKGYFATVGHLFLKPGRITSEFLKGRTIAYTNPFKYLLITVFLVVLCIQFFPDFYIPDEDDSVGIEWKLYLIFSIVFLSLYVFHALVFRTQFGKLDVLILTIFEGSQMLLLMIPSIILSGLLKLGDGVFFIITWFSLAVIYHTLFTVKVFSGRILKKVIISIVGMMLSIVAISLVITAIIHLMRSR